MPRPSRGANGWTRRQNVKTSEPTPAFIAPVLAAGVLMAMLMGTRSSMGLFIGPINTATALGAATVSFAFALSQLGWGAAQPLAGLLAGRFGTARVVIAGGVVSAIGLALITVAASGPALMATLLVAGAAGAASGGAPLLMGAVAQRVSAEKRGLAMGLVSAGSSAGQLLLAPLAALLIAGIGWQVAMLVFAVLVVAVLPAALVFRRPPLLRLRLSHLVPDHPHAGRARAVRLLPGLLRPVAGHRRRLQHRRQPRFRLADAAGADEEPARHAVRAARGRRGAVPARARQP
jgi:MFS family permease